MKMNVQVVIESEEGQTRVEKIASFTRGTLSAASLGLSLAEAKDLLSHLQESLVTEQISEYLQEQRRCPHCGRERVLKGHHTLTLRTLFGKLSLPSPRLRSCECEDASRGTGSISPLAALLAERTAPELAYLQVKWASLMSYGLSVDLLAEVLPLAGQVNTTSVRRQVQRVGERVEEALGPEQAT